MEISSKEGVSDPLTAEAQRCLEESVKIKNEVLTLLVCRSEEDVVRLVGNTATVILACFALFQGITIHALAEDAPHCASKVAVALTTIKQALKHVEQINNRSLY